MTHSTVRVACHVCDGAGEVVDERGLWVVCGECMGHGFKFENPDGPMCATEDAPASASPLADR